MDTKVIKLNCHYKGLNAGEVGGFRAEVADALVKAGKATHYDKNATPVLGNQVEPVSEAVTMLEVEELLDNKVDAIKSALTTKTSSGSYVYPEQYLAEALDYESLNKGRNKLMEWILEESEKRS